MATYAWICCACEHPTSQHLLPEEAPIGGPYTCRIGECDCRMMRGDPDYGITQAEYTRRYSKT